MSTRRTEKVAELLKHEISDIIKMQLKDPFIGFVTLTDVVLTNDLRTAKVYFSVLGDSSQKEASLKGLQRASGFIQREIGNRIKLRYLPVLSFYLDESLSYANRIEAIIEELKSEEPDKHSEELE